LASGTIVLLLDRFGPTVDKRLKSLYEVHCGFVSQSGTRPSEIGTAVTDVPVSRLLVDDRRAATDGVSHVFGQLHDGHRVAGTDVVRGSNRIGFRGETVRTNDVVDVNPGTGVWKVVSSNPVSIQSGYGSFSADFGPI
jgi:hypothetical protein